MKHYFMILFVLFLSGCTITGKVVNEIGEADTALDKDYKLVIDAVEDKDVSKCYYVLNQDIREDCFMKMAEVLDDKSICDNLLPNLRDKCISQ